MPFFLQNAIANYYYCYDSIGSACLVDYDTDCNDRRRNANVAPS